MPCSSPVISTSSTFTTRALTHLDHVVVWVVEEELLHSDAALQDGLLHKWHTQLAQQHLDLWQASSLQAGRTAQAAASAAGVGVF